MSLLPALLVARKVTEVVPASAGVGAQLARPLSGSMLMVAGPLTIEKVEGVKLESITWIENDWPAVAFKELLVKLSAGRSGRTAMEVVMTLLPTTLLARNVTGTLPTSPTD